jgi:hypothetical protein
MTDTKIADSSHECYSKDIDVFFYKDSSGGISAEDVETPMVHIICMKNRDLSSLCLHPKQARELVSLVSQALKRNTEDYDADKIGVVK